MKSAIRHSLCNFITRRFPSAVGIGELSAAIVEHICSPEFSALYEAQRTHPAPTSDVETTLNQWRLSMSTATDAMAAAITNLQSQIKAGGVTADQVSSQITAAVTPLTTQIQTILTSEGSDASKIADIQNELAEFTTAFASPSSGSGSSASGTGTPPTTTPAPTSAPAA